MRFHSFMEDLVGSEVKIRLWRLLSSHPTRSLTGREIAAELKVSPWYVGKLLKLYESHGILRRQHVGKAFLWSVNEEHVLFRKMEQLFGFERKGKDELATFLKRWLGKAPVRSIYLFGSVARGTESEKSDIDILIVCKNGKRQVAEELVEEVRDYVYDNYGNSLSPIMYEQKEFAGKQKTPLVKKIMKEGIKIHG